MLKAVSAVSEELILFTQDIIRFPSLTGEERPLAQFVLARLQEIGLDEAFVDRAGNVVGVLHGTRPGPNILLNSHLDVVPAGNRQNWGPYDPFGGQIDPEGNIRGRGAADLKGGLSVQVYALKLLKQLRDRGTPLSGTVIFSSVVHEEAAEMLGMDYLLRETLPERDLPVDVVFLCEPTSLRVVLGHRGKVELVVTTQGRTAHSSTPHLGINALQKMVPVLDHVFNRMGRNLRSHPELGESSITITNLLCRPGALSITPDECEISIDRRYMPGESLDEVIAEFDDLFETYRKADPQFRATVQPRRFIERTYTGCEKEVQKYHPPWITPRDDPFVMATLRALQGVGQEAETGYWKFGTDGSMSAGLLGIPTIGYSGMEERFAHSPEEQVNIGHMITSLEGYAAILCELMEISLSELD